MLLSIQWGVLVVLVVVTGFSFPDPNGCRHADAPTRNRNALYSGASSSNDKITATTTMESPVHLQHNDDAETATSNNTEEDDTDSKNSTNTITVHTYRDTSSFQTFKALNTSIEKFQSYLSYIRGAVAPDNSRITTTETKVMDDISQWKRLWGQHRLITDRTEWLSRHSHSFPDLLSLYAERVWGFYEPMEGDHLRQWLEGQYPEWRQLKATHMKELEFEEQKALLKGFLECFRSEYPYFYDRCEHCGASKREDNHGDPQQTFVGYIHPNAAETSGKAMRTELYQCHVCSKFTRFPRYNSVRHVLQHKKGRCGEYSMLLFRILRFLGHDARWVVDWADHVWGEIYLHGTWVHLDPCEAAVDENLIYQNWGKRQVFIVGFWLPHNPKDTLRHALVEDVTDRYTTKSWDSIRAMREESDDQVQAAIQNATRTLQGKLGIATGQRNETANVSLCV